MLHFLKNILLFVRYVQDSTFRTVHSGQYVQDSTFSTVHSGQSHNIKIDNISSERLGHFKYL